jgi:hypothetical protein
MEIKDARKKKKVYKKELKESQREITLLREEIKHLQSKGVKENPNQFFDLILFNNNMF